MKNLVLRTAALSGVFAAASALVHAPALAQDAAPKKAVTVLGYSEATVNLFASDEQGTPDFRSGFTSLRVDYTEGMALGRVQVELKGGAGTTDTFFIRNANAGLKLPSDTELRFGRYRPMAPKAWGLWATATAGNFGSVDGLEIRQPIALSSLKLDLGLGFGNAHSTASDFKFADRSAADTAIFAFAGTNISGVVAQVAYGMAPKTPSAIAPTPTASDISVLKLAVGYEMAGLGAGFWLNNMTAAKPKTYTLEGNKLKTGADIAASTATTDLLWGVGVNADSSLFGTTGIMAAGDKFFFGGSFEMASKAQPDAAQAVKDGLKNADKTTIVVGGGYAVAAFGTELNIISESVKDKAGTGNTLTDKKGAAAKSKTSAVLAAYVDF